MIVNKSVAMRKAQFIAAVIVLGALFSCKKGAPAAEAIPAESTVTSPDLKMRIAPNTTAVEIARLSRGETVKIVQRSVETVQIGKFDAHWYKVTNSAGLTGWVYGAHLAVESDAGEAAQIAVELEKKLKDAILGRWDAAKLNGSLTANFVTFTSAGDVEFGYGRKATGYGKYTTAFVDGVLTFQVTELANPPMTDIKAKFVGETLVFTGTLGKGEYKLNLADKNPELFRDADKKKAATP